MNEIQYKIAEVSNRIDKLEDALDNILTQNEHNEVIVIDGSD